MAGCDSSGRRVRAWPHGGKTDSLPKIRPACDFNLTAQDGERLSLEALRGKVVVVTFIFASCAHTCRLLTTKMTTVQSRLGDEFGRHAYLSVTVDPERDTPHVLKRYAEAHGVKLGGGWSFVTGEPAEIRKVARNYGVAYREAPAGRSTTPF